MWGRLRERALPLENDQLRLTNAQRPTANPTAKTRLQGVAAATAPANARTLPVFSATGTTLIRMTRHRQTSRLKKAHTGKLRMFMLILYPTTQGKAIEECAGPLQSVQRGEEVATRDSDGVLSGMARAARRFSPESAARKSPGAVTVP